VSRVPIRLRWRRGSGLSSAAIAWFSAGQFSHVDAVLDGTLYGARSDNVGGGKGVRARPYPYEKSEAVMVLELPVAPQLYQAWRSFLIAQNGKPYDSTAIWGFGLDRDWRDPDSWFCSELQMAALEAAGICHDVIVPAYKVTPVALSAVFSALGAYAVTDSP